MSLSRCFFKRLDADLVVRHDCRVWLAPAYDSRALRHGLILSSSVEGQEEKVSMEPMAVKVLTLVGAFISNSRGLAVIEVEDMRKAGLRRCLSELDSWPWRLAEYDHAGRP